MWHQLADNAGQTADDPASATNNVETDVPQQAAVNPVRIHTLANGDQEVTNATTGKTFVLSRQSQTADGETTHATPSTSDPQSPNETLGTVSPTIAEGAVEAGQGAEVVSRGSSGSNSESTNGANQKARRRKSRSRRSRRSRRNLNTSLKTLPEQLTGGITGGIKGVGGITGGIKSVGQSLKTLSRQPRFWLLLGLGMGGGVGTSAVVWGFYQVEAMTNVAIADVVSYTPPGTMTIKAANGQILQQIGNVSHDKLELGKIPPLVEQAFVASEDRRFREHRGVDLQGILRASVSNAKSGEVVQGGSTITQQLARLVFLTQDRTYARKIKELRLAQKIETTLPKDQILERYLNLIYLGSGAYGVADAAYAYFSKSPQDLTLGEAATLAGVVPAPSVYSPLENLEAATKRRNQVLTKMAEVGFISEQEAQAAIAEPLKVKPSPLKRFNREAEFFTDYVLKELEAKLPEEQLKSGGLTVNTTLNLNWQNEAQGILKQSVDKYGKWQRFSEGAMVSIDPRTGAIKMMVGGKDYEGSQFNRVFQAKRQPGSTFKPILYATAIASGISPEKSYPNVPFEINGYKPENYGDKYSGGNMSLRTALTNSVNVVAVRLLIDVGWNPVINLARKMGITSPLEPTYSLALGAWEMTPLEMAGAYGTFANKGIHVTPFAIQNVTNAKGETIYKAKHQQNRALDADSNAIMTSMMRSVVTSGTGRPAQLGDRQVAGKTGTSDKARDLWFIGYIPQLVTAVWIGNDNNQPTKGASTTAAIIWGDYMRDVVKGMPVEYFPAMPKNPDARKPSIKAEPLNRRRIKVLAAPAPEATTSETDAPPRRRRRRSRTEASAPTSERVAYVPSRRRSRTEARDSAPRQSAPQRVVRATSVSPSPAAPAAETAAPPSAGLPAPPAARKTE